MEKEILTGEKIQQMADIYIGNKEDFSFNPFIYQQEEKHCPLDSINETFSNPPIVFCYSHCIYSLTEKIHLFKNDFVLLTHNSDENINDCLEVNHLLSYPQLKKWFSQNVCFSHPKLHYLPIGLANSQWPHGDLSFFKDKNLDDPFIKSEKVYFHFNISTNHSKRTECYDILKDKIPFLSQVTPSENLERLQKYEFCICPEGNGIDTHRFWECFYLKVIPIVVDSPFVQILKKERVPIPIVILDKWEDFDESNLQYTDFSFDHLEIYLSDFEKKIRNTIK